MKKSGFYGMMMLSAAGLLMAGCTEDLLDGRQGEVPIYLTATVSEGNGHASTRAGVDIQSTQLPSGTTFAAEFTGNAVTVSSVTYTADGNGGISSVSPSQPYFTLSGTSTTVHAYCPSKPSGTFSVQTNQSGDANYKASDLLYASTDITKTGAATTAALQFSHKMAKVIVNATLGDGISSISAVKIVGGYRTINITDATTCTLGSTLSDANSSSNITVYSGTHSSGTLSCAALLPPQTVIGAFLVITTDQGDVTYTLDSKAFAIGQSYTFNVTVNAAAIGSSIDITNWEDNGSVTVNPTEVVSNPDVKEHKPSSAQAVDLGLSVKWANMNVGATAVTDFGTYFAWGEVVGYTVQGSTTDPISPPTTKTTYTFETYLWGHDEYSLIKYNETDGKTTLDLCDDAAYIHWGGRWRMPTKEEWEELANDNNCTWTATTQNNVKGFLVTSRKPGYTSNSIFIPAAGIRDHNSFGKNNGYQGFYSSSTLNSIGDYTRNYGLMLDEWSHEVGAYWPRWEGLSIRPVYDSYVPMSNVTDSDIGKIICSKGHIHNTVSAVDCGGTASGVIAYVGYFFSDYKGIALALYDCGGNLMTDGTTCQWYTDNSGTCLTYGQSSTVGTAIGTSGYFYKGFDNTNSLARAACGSGHVHAAAQNAKNFSAARPSGASQWFLPTMYHWNLMVKAMCGKSTNLTTSTNNDYKAAQFNTKITAAGGRGVKSGLYWASVEYDAANAWNMDFEHGAACGNSKSGNGYVRAVFAF